MSLWPVTLSFKQSSVRQSPPPESEAVLVKLHQDCLEIDKHWYVDVHMREFVSA